MINLHERLSEFSYGYGVTREVERRLAARGLRATPFLPSLLHEASLGFDVAFSGPGQVVMLQFKLGQELSRFRRLDPSETIPALSKPFWRYYVDTTEHQFLRLEEFEAHGADVFYVAPRFSHWSAYDAAFHGNQVLQRSLLLRPSEIQRGSGGTPGEHRIVYDRIRRYVCSEPRAVEEVTPDELVEKLDVRARSQEPLISRLERLVSSERARGTPQLARSRQRDIRSRARTPADGLAAIVGLEAWLQGTQVLFITPFETAVLSE
ncbi:hypothetical protein AA309_17425 [Microvirga vignae]|uniref:Uncharacterized protein n=1 Tax=Microvirga vignae TaxID=1225564 RepID=A0A0H1RAN1_9HYPH|nr:hypothetical protein [Microvirga vignae]KLK91886.1 hypothetical protein AA309_17425 [Microvirga vignae]